MAAIFASHEVKALPDLSLELLEDTDWQAGRLTTLDYHLQVTAFATDPTSGLFALGTATGKVHIYGAAGVKCRLQLPDPLGVRVKFIQFAPSAFKLVCVDGQERLHVWDLAAEGRPRLQKTARFGGAINGLTVSPSHTHAFVALADGAIKTYDLLCLRISQYAIPNLWRLYKEKSLAAGATDVESAGSDVIIDMVVHPRDLNLLFVAYEGGVVVSDLKAENTVRAFELLLPPGAPGGSGYHSPDILSHRRGSVTALAIHPSGHILAIGYADGTIAFWSLEDEDKPLVLRNLDSDDSEDLSVVDATKLESAQGQTPEPPREPIFKLAWSGFPNSSDPRGGDTVLTILGGLTIDAFPGVTSLLLPCLQPPAPPTPTSPGKSAAPMPMHPQTRAAIRASLVAKDVHTYATAGPVQDFVLLPKSSPHFAGAFDPQAIFVISDSEVPEARVFEAFEFPPPVFGVVPPPIPAVPEAQLDASNDGAAEQELVEELATTLDDLAVTNEPRIIQLPPSLWNVLGENVVQIRKAAYARLVRDKDTNIDGELPFPARGGIAWQEDLDGQMKLLKLQPHRILATHLADLTVRFLDLSSQLLSSTAPDAPLSSDFPDALPALTIDLKPLLIDTSLGLAAANNTTAQMVSSVANERIDVVRIAPEALECVVVLRSGAAILFRLDGDGEQTGMEQTFIKQTLEDEELVSLTHIRVPRGRRFAPVLGVKPDPKRGAVTSYAISDVGFFAVAYASGALYVVDLRGPRIIWRHEPHVKEDRRRSFLSQSVEPYVCMEWASCCIASDSTARIRLLATMASGSTKLFTIAQTPTSSWTITPSPSMIDGIARPFTHGSYVLDAKTGTPCCADRAALVATMQGDSDVRERKVFWLLVGAKGARTALNVDGARIAKVEWSSKVGAVVHAEVVSRETATVLVAYTTHGTALVYTLPFLELLHTLQLPATGGSSDPPTTDHSGDYVTHTPFPAPAGAPHRLLSSTELHTLFAFRRTAPYAAPEVDLAWGRGAVPAQPQPVSLGPSSVLGSWLGYIGSLGTTSAGDQIDALLAGPDRPIPAASGGATVRRGVSPSRPAVSGTSPSPAAATAAMTSSVGDLYNRLGNALAERGQMLGELQETFDSMERGSKNMVAQAKSLAAQQTAKRWFGF